MSIQLIIALAIFFIGFIYATIKGGKQQKQMYEEYSENGVVAEAVISNVVRKRAPSKRGRSSHHYDSFFPDDEYVYDVYVTFTDNRGETVEKKLKDPRTHEIGTPIEIMYLPDELDDRNYVYRADELKNRCYDKYREK